MSQISQAIVLQVPGVSLTMPTLMSTDLSYWNMQAINGRKFITFKSQTKINEYN